MSLVRRRIGKRTYLYFKLPGPAEIYLGPEVRPDLARVEEAMRYTRTRVRHYENLLNQLERLTGIHEKERRRPQVQTAAERLSPEERTALLRFSLAEFGLTSYELERRGIKIPPLPTIGKLSKLGLIRRLSKTRTPAGRVEEKYVATSPGARIALDNLSSETNVELDEHTLREMAEGNFEKTPIGTVYLQAMRLKARAGLH